METSSLKSGNKHSALKRLRTLSHLLDNAIPIPGTRFRLGLDPLLGLLPGAGDFLGAVLSAYIVVEAARFGLPRETLVQMLTNLVLDSVGGSLPVVGDIFDATWKANTRNLALLEAHVATPEPKKAADRRFVALIIVGVVVVVLGFAVLVALLVNWALKAANG